MRYWSLGFFAIAVLAAVVGFNDRIEPLTVARTLFGITLLLFCVMLLIKVWDRDQDGHSDT